MIAPRPEELHNLDAAALLPADEDPAATQLTTRPDEPPGGADADHLLINEEEDERADIMTLDSVFLHDVPVASDQHVRKITITTVAKDGSRQQEERDGKILYRTGPHPTMVMVGNQVVDRKQADSMEGPQKAIMVPLLTAVIYDRGVVQADHVDVMHCLLHKMQDTRRTTGRADGRIVTTKQEIAQLLQVSHNGHHSQMVEDALDTLAGLRVIKCYQAPQEGQPGFGIVPTVTIKMGGIIVNSSVLAYGGASTSSGGRRPDVITVDMNPAFVRTMCGMLDEKPYLLRSMNLTQNQRYHVQWKRQLHRVLEGRLDRNKYFQIPLEELWVQTLGCDAADFDPARPERRRKMRWKIQRVLNEMKAVGYLDVGMIENRDAAAEENQGAQEITIATGDHEEIKVPSKHSDRAVRPTQYVEWLVCSKGPSYYHGRSMSKPDFARKLLLATLEEGADVDTQFEKLGTELIIDVAYKSLKEICNLLGEWSGRVPIELWLGIEYPKADRDYLVRKMIDEHLQDLKLAALARRMQKRIPAAHEDRRRAYLERNRRTHFVNVNYDALLSGARKPKNEGETEATACVRLAYDYLAREHGLPKREPELFTADQQRAHEKILAAASEIGEKAALQNLWFARMKRICAGNLPKMGDRWQSSLAAPVKARFPKAWNITCEMSDIQTRSMWEVHVAERFRRRIAERYLEEQELVSCEKRLDQGAP